MKAEHFLKDNKLENEVATKEFLLGNGRGDYIWLDEKPRSRYQGWFFNPESQEELVKVIESFNLEAGPVKKLVNRFDHVIREREEVTETFSMSKEGHGFEYKLSEKRAPEIVLDVRPSYNVDVYPEYELSKEGKFLVIQVKTKEEDYYLAISGFDSFEWIGERFARFYKLDQDRNSPPFERAVFKALKLKGKSFRFSIFKDKKKALKTLRNFKSRTIDLKYSEPLDFVASEVGLDNLTTDRGIYAGFPWFFQYWKRDEAISLKGLKIIDEKKAESIFWELLEKEPQGPRGNYIADGIGWTYKRGFLFLNEISQDKEEKIKNHLNEDINWLLDNRTKNGFAISEKKETWMDSIPREGARLEMQALRLAMYKLGKIIDSDNSSHYQRLEEKLRERTREKLWDGSVLADGFNPDTGEVDKTVRPNIFLAYYIYPDLLEDDEWKQCFRKALYELWLDWGGLATISTENPKFNLEHTGENPQSYHQGDSWFFINNLAAICMHRLDSKSFSYEINKILKASRVNILWQGAIGHHSEVSSANELRAEGAISQAWSFATYLEALYEIYKIRNYGWE